MSAPPAGSETPLDAPPPNSVQPNSEQPNSEQLSPASQKRISRRNFLRRAIRTTAGAGAAAFLYTWRIEPHWVEVVHRPLPISRLPTALEGKRLVQISDVHVGPVVDQSFLLRSAERIAALEPDLLVLTGDFMTCRRDEQVSRVAEFVSALPKPPLGRFGILGNHDYGDRWRQDQAAGRLVDHMDRLEMNVLRNDVADVEGLQIAGVDELWSRHFNPPSAIGKLDASRAMLALCHNPDGVDRPEWDGFTGWILAGHTHGGQCKPPFLPPPLTPVRNKRYVAGEYALDGNRQLYINRGLGYLHRVRFNARPEITVFTLQRTDA